jgi:hypothetical protein
MTKEKELSLMRERSPNLQPPPHPLSRRELILDMFLRRPLPQQFQAPLREVDHFALVVVFGLIIRLERAVGDLLHHADNIVRLADEPDQLLILRLEQLEQRPDGYMLERGVSAAEEPAEVAVDAITGLGPVLDEDAVVAHYMTQKLAQGFCVPARYDGYKPLDERLPNAAALLP